MANSAKISGLNINLTELTADGSPQLGGNLDLNSNDITGTGNINTTGTVTASGTITGSTFSGSGASLTNLPSAQLTGALPAIDGSSLTGINTDLVSDTTPQLGGNLDAQSNNITNLGTINTHTVPGGTGTLALTSDITLTPSSTDTLTNKTINLSSNTLSGTTAQFNTALSDGSFRIGYQSGEIIEKISSIADGSTLSTSQGNVTFQNVTSVQLLNTSYVDVTGSTISYTPPTEATRVIYEFAYQIGAQDGSDSILHAKFYIDGDEVTSARHNSGAYRAMYTNFVWVIDCAASSADTSIGALTSWTSAKTLKLTSRAYSTSYDQYYHNTRWWDGASATSQVTRPVLTITAIA